jgi:hypothetical protein
VGWLPGQVESGAGRILRRRNGRLAARSLSQRDHVVGLLARRRFPDFVHRYDLDKKAGALKKRGRMGGGLQGLSQ